MARQARLSRPGLPLYIVQHGHDGQAIVRDDEDRAAWRTILEQVMPASRVALHAWALQDTAFHLVLTPLQEGEASRLMQLVGRRHAAAFNRRHARSGTLWAGRFRSCVVEPGAALLACMRQVDALGLGLDAQAAAKTVETAETTKWSSLAHHIGQRADPLLTDPPAYWALGNTPFEREAAWRRLIEEGLPPAEADRIAGAVRRGWPLGSGAFVASLAAAAGRPVGPQRRGRPPGRKLASGS